MHLQRFDRPTTFCDIELESSKSSTEIEENTCEKCIQYFYQLSLTHLRGTAIFTQKPQNFDIDYRTDDPYLMKPKDSGSFYAKIFREHTAHPLCYNNALSNIERLLSDDYKSLKIFNSIIHDQSGDTAGQ